MGRMYELAAPSLRVLAPHLLPQPASGKHQGRKIRIGFLSKFFVVNHAHGQLLSGVIAKLDRSLFHVLLLCIPNTQQHEKSLGDSADEVETCSFCVTTSQYWFETHCVRVLQVHHTPLNLVALRSFVASLHLDVLVVADIMSEPLSYFLMFSRLARVQCVFWGNPITSGALKPSILCIGCLFLEYACTHVIPFLTQLCRLTPRGLLYFRGALGKWGRCTGAIL